MEKKMYAYFFPSVDEDGPVSEAIVELTDEDITLSSLDDTRQNLVSFLAQTNDAYIDKWNVVHEVTAYEDQPFAWYFEVIDNVWDEVLGETGAYLDDSENKDMPECVRAGFEKIYNYAHSKVFNKK